MRTHCTAKAILAAMEQGLASNVHADAPLPALLLPVSPDEGMNDTGIGNEEKAVGARAVVGRAAATHKAKATIKAKAHNGARRGGKGSGKNESRDAGKNDNTTTKASTSEDGNGERGTNGKNNDYDKRLAALQASIARATRRKAFAHHSMVLVFEGQDAAGKGGTIRRVTAALDVRDYDVHPISAPTDEERARPYLWRFWRHLPAVGKAAIFDRSWYGRVLVERVEKLATVHAIDRAYDEINDFELQLAESGALVLKFWLDVSKDVQLQRFHEREKSPFKSFKITPDDWRNRAKWNAYQNARRDMLVRTCTEHAPWHVIQSDDKKAARLQVLAVIAEALQGLR
ncbi:hypothetical protein GSY71_09355 [Pusillimonas sp. TS35]|nr:hypothetical protein [Pusillimonas sp. TS35]